MENQPPNIYICANTHTHAQHTCACMKMKKESTTLESHNVIRNIDRTEENFHSLPKLSCCLQKERLRPKPAGFFNSLPQEIVHFPARAEDGTGESSPLGSQSNHVLCLLSKTVLRSRRT